MKTPVHAAGPDSETAASPTVVPFIGPAQAHEGLSASPATNSHAGVFRAYGDTLSRRYFEPVSGYTVDEFLTAMSDARLRVATETAMFNRHTVNDPDGGGGLVPPVVTACTFRFFTTTGDPAS